MCSVNIRGQAWRAFQIEVGKGRVQSQGRYVRFVSSNKCIEAQIIRENIQHNYLINFYHSEERTGSYFKKPQRCKTVQSIIFMAYIRL